MLRPTKLRSVFGDHYTILPIGSGLPTAQLETLTFDDILSARLFVNNLDVGEGVWRQLACEYRESIPYLRASGDGIDLIVDMLVKGKLCVFKTPNIDINTCPVEDRTFRSDVYGGVSYQIAPASEALFLDAPSIREFSSVKSATEFINSTSPSPEQLDAILTMVNGSKLIDAVKLSYENLVKSLAEAVVKQKAVVVLNKTRTPNATAAVESADNTPGNRVVPLAEVEETQWCNLVLTQEGDDASAVPIEASIIFLTKDQQDTSASTDKEGAAQVSIPGGKDTLDITEMKIDNDVCYEFVSLS